MTDISVIKMIISVAVWRIYPSWVNNKLRAWEGLGHSGMFWARLSRDDLRSKLEIISFLSRVMSVSKSFIVSRAFERFGAKRSSSWAFGFDDVSGVFLKTPLRHRAFFCKLRVTTTTSIFRKFPFFFPKQSRCYLPDSYGDLQAEQSTLVMARRKLEWKPDVRALARSSAEGSSIVVAIGRSRVRWSMVQKRKKHKETSVWLCEVSTFHHLQTSEFGGACSRDPMSLPFRTSLFSWTWKYRCKTVRLQRGESEESSHPWHFRCWSLRRNELECTDLVHWTGAWHRFLSRDAIIVVGSMLEKHFEGGFNPDQEKEITFKRWPPGYQSWKLGLALNGLSINVWSIRVFQADGRLVNTRVFFFFFKRCTSSLLLLERVKQAEHELFVTKTIFGDDALLLLLTEDGHCRQKTFS